MPLQLVRMSSFLINNLSILRLIVHGVPSQSMTMAASMNSWYGVSFPWSVSTWLWRSFELSSLKWECYKSSREYNCLAALQRWNEARVCVDPQRNEPRDSATKGFEYDEVTWSVTRYILVSRRTGSSRTTTTDQRSPHLITWYLFNIYWNFQKNKTSTIVFALVSWSYRILTFHNSFHNYCRSRLIRYR